MNKSHMTVAKINSVKCLSQRVKTCSFCLMTSYKGTTAMLVSTTIQVHRPI